MKNLKIVHILYGITLLFASCVVCMHVDTIQTAYRKNHNDFNEQYIIVWIIFGILVITSIYLLIGKLRKYKKKNNLHQILIVGKKGTDKTKYIVKNVIPRINKFKVLDFKQGEYFKYVKSENIIIGINSESKHAFEKCIKNIFDDTHKDTVLIMDDAYTKLYPLDSFNREDRTWFEINAYNKQYVVVCESIEQVEETFGIEHLFKQVYLFSTNDDKNRRDWFIKNLKHRKIAIKLIK